MSSSPSKPERRPVDYVDGAWPESTRIVADEGDAAAYVAEQFVHLVRAIIRRREERGLRRSQLAQMTGLRPNTISDLENGQTWPDVRTLGLIAWALDADIEFVPRETVRRLKHPQQEPT
ncbi:MAG: helix-turn-helix domain-containing protein [Actinobacteria bacterium]|nr:helix-turn-helix domain-containing protein [Actinomycetota bacterium]